MREPIKHGGGGTVRLGDCWGSIRSVLHEKFSTAEIRAIVGAAGVPLFKVHSFMRNPDDTHKEPLLMALDRYMGTLTPEDADRIIVAIIEEMILKKPSVEDRLDQVLNRVGWGVSGGRPYPLDLQITIEVANLPDAIRDNLERAVKRYRDGDAAGAMTAICGAIDSVTAAIYSDNSWLGNHRDANYQERVARSFSLYESTLVNSLVSSGMDRQKANEVWHNLRGAVNHAAYILRVYRSQYADVHGNVAAPPALVQHALDCATFVLRCFEWHSRGQ